MDRGLGLLEPAEIDSVNGYRYYATEQVAVARLIRRFRDLEMPVPDLKAYVAAPDEATRAAIVSDHLDRMQAQLRQPQDAVTAARTVRPDRIPATHRGSRRALRACSRDHRGGCAERRRRVVGGRDA